MTKRIVVLATAFVLSADAERILAAAPAAATPAAAAATSGPAAAIAFLEAKVRRDPQDFIALNMLAVRYLDRYRSGSGDSDLALAADAARRSLAAIPPELNTGGLAARARVELATHRFAEARDDALRLLELAPNKPYPQKLLGDALLELGDYDQAETAYAEMRRRGDDGTIDAEYRRARVAFFHGKTDEARTHLAAALEHARDAGGPDTVAWCAVQLGELEFTHGRWDEAERRYAEALDAVPDSLPALEHLAELRAAAGKYEDALERYGRLVARSSRPELLQAVGDLYAFQGKTEEARTWHERALAGYRKSVAEGWVHYYHHLAGFFSDAEPDGAAAVEWAEKDLQLRKSVYALDAFAWALHRAGRERDADAAMKQALAVGTEDAHLLYHAGIIASSAGDVVAGKRFLERAVKVNPRYNAFHVHR